MEKKFILSAEESELLIHFETLGSTDLIAKSLGKDPSVISRMIKRLADKIPVLEKRSGRWILTDLGKRFNELSLNTMNAQHLLSQNQTILKLGTNREFGARILGPAFGELRKSIGISQILVNTYEMGTEKALLDGLIDIGIDCNRPNDPDIAYKLVLEEPIVAIASSQFYKKHKKQISFGQYLSLPHLQFNRLQPDKVLEQTSNNHSIIASFNDIATTRAVCLSGEGWALLPFYCVREEIQDGSLIQIDSKMYAGAKYGVWWIRRRKYLRDSVNKVHQWLKTKTLDA